MVINSIPSRDEVRLPPAKLLTASLAIVFLFALTATMVSAHALLVRSEPADGEILEESPAQVVAWFSEELDSSQSGLRVFDVQDRQLDKGDGAVDLEDLDHLSMVVTLPPVLSGGRYTVRWAVVSAEDGDATEGEFTFDVGSESTADESAPPTGNTNMGWLLGGLALVLVVIVIILVSFGRRRGRLE
jgi:copper transport protein